MSVMASPVAPESAARLLDMQNENDKLAYAKQLGARNTNPPLPHSPCVRIKATGKIFPWNELLAEQGDLCECCDANGNTDPEAWKPLVIEGASPDAELHMQAQNIIMDQSRALTEEYRVQNAVNMTPHNYPEGAVSYSDMLDAETVDAMMAVKAMA